jgi:hypothetical protein
MPKKPISFEVEYVEQQDLAITMSEFAAEACAEKLLDCHVNGNHAEMAVVMASTPDVSMTLCRLIDNAIEHRLVENTTKAAAIKHQKSDYPELKAQVLAFFHTDAHRCDDRTGKPIYRSKSAFLEEARAVLLKELANAKQKMANAQQFTEQAAALKKRDDVLQSLTPRAMGRWLDEEVRSQIPSHWPVRAD